MFDPEVLQSEVRTLSSKVVKVEEELALVKDTLLPNRSHWRGLKTISIFSIGFITGGFVVATIFSSAVGNKSPYEFFNSTLSSNIERETPKSVGIVNSGSACAPIQAIGKSLKDKTGKYISSPLGVSVADDTASLPVEERESVLKDKFNNIPTEKIIPVHEMTEDELLDNPLGGLENLEVSEDVHIVYKKRAPTEVLNKKPLSEGELLIGGTSENILSSSVSDDLVDGSIYGLPEMNSTIPKNEINASSDKESQAKVASKSSSNKDAKKKNKKKNKKD